jgi:hypothetical protein
MHSYSHGELWSSTNNNYQTWSTIINHGKPQSNMVMVNYSEGRA